MPYPSPLRLLVVDPQNDFCDWPDGLCPEGVRPALPVPGAHVDMTRLAGWVGAHEAEIDDILVTLDTHRRLDIAHPGFWRKRDGSPVVPFTEIRSAQLESGEFVLADTSGYARALDYLRQLETQGRYILMVWPEHCIEGTWGHEVHPAVQTAVDHWATTTGKPVRYLKKGQNPWTEHYSALQAEVPDPSDPRTQFNQAVADWAGQAQTLVVAGEAGSHCVGATVQHLLDHWAAGQARHVVVLKDCMSPVAGFESTYQDWLRKVQARGVSVALSA